jgi:hypothetical protein
MESATRTLPELLGELLELIAEEATVMPGGNVLLPANVLPLLAELITGSSARGTPDVDVELMFERRWVTTEAAALRLGCTTRWIRALAGRNALSAHQVAGRWLIDTASISRHLAETATAPPPATGEPERRPATGNHEPPRNGQPHQSGKEPQ